MKAILSIAALLAAFPAAAQTAPAQPARPQMALPRSNPAELPKIFAAKVAVTDLDRAERFYKEGLGAVSVSVVQPRERAVHFKSGLDLILVLRAPTASAPPRESLGGFIVQVADIDAAVARIVPAGGTVVSPPNSGAAANSFGVRAAQIKDPDGVGIELIQFPAPKP